MSRAPGTARARPWLLGAAILPFAALGLSQWDYVPIWDARIYTDCLLDAAARGPFPAAYVCADHPTVAWAAIASLLSHLAPDRFGPVLVMQLLLGALALWAFFDVTRLLFPERERDALGLTACLGVFPVVVAGAVDPNPDFGVLVFFLLLVRALLRERFLEAGAVAVLLSLCKETGVLLVVVTAGVHALLALLRAPGSLAVRLRAVLRYAPTLAGPAAFGAWLALRPARPGSPHGQLWGGHSLGDLVRLLFSLDLQHPVFRAQLAGIFVLQFAWLLTLPAAWRWGRKLWGLVRRTPSGEAPGLVFLDALFFVTLFALTRFRTFLNVRYVLPLYPLLLLCAAAALRDLPARSRSALLVAVSCLFLVSNHRTVDPVSRGLWGTFAFGEHALLRMTSLTGECCGEGRDQLVYNLEHTQLHRLQDLAYRALELGRDREPAAHPLADWYLTGPVDPATRGRTLARGAPVQHTLTPQEIARGRRPLRLFYLRYPNFGDNASQEAALAPWYVAGAVRRFERSGYALEVVELTRR